MSTKFTERAGKVLDNAVGFAEEFGHTYIGSEHILLALAEDKDSHVAEVLARYGVDSEKIKNAIVDYDIGCGYKTHLTPRDITPKVRKLLMDVTEISKQNKDDIIKTEHIFLAICKGEESRATIILHKLGVDLEKILL